MTQHKTYNVIKIKPKGRSKSIYDENIAKGIREKFKLDHVDRNGQNVIVKFSDKLDAVGTSFIFALFGPSLNYLQSVDKLFDIYSIEANDIILNSICADIYHMYRNKNY